ncbi:MAG TPA: hypothetical protein VFP21_02525, partial [Solirubrobacterales bacterium]|nr:hypothetical protein [Solirubrobacterales bacterium]
SWAPPEPGQVEENSGILQFAALSHPDSGPTGVQSPQTEFQRFKHCFFRSNNVLARKTLFETAKTLFRRLKQCLKPKNNV